MSQDTDNAFFSEAYEQLRVRYDADAHTVWYSMNPRTRPCFNLDLLAELGRFQATVAEINDQALANGSELPVHYTVLASDVDGVFNMGGDLALFADLIRRGDGDGLLRYATACIDVLYPNAVGFNQPVTTVSLVQGDALGGGMEAAISSNIIIAEESARFGLPEFLFNLIPGMGAYSFLIRRTDPAITKRIITSGGLLTAQEMFDLHLIDDVAEDGKGEEAVTAYLKTHSKRRNAHLALDRARRCLQPITYEELINITTIWAEAALHLTPRDLVMIERLVQAQNRRIGLNKPSNEALEASG